MCKYRNIHCIKNGFIFILECFGHGVGHTNGIVVNCIVDCIAIIRVVLVVVAWPCGWSKELTLVVGWL